MDKKIEHLGILSGPVLLFGGIYSNLQSLEKLISLAEKHNIPPENCICTGDLMGYCAQPEEVIQAFKAWGARSILGNVEIQLREGANHCGCDFRKGSRCDAFSQMWYPYAQSKLSKKSLKFIARLPDHIQFNYVDKTIMVVHGSWFHVSEYIFKSTPWETKLKNFEATQSNVMIAGHCGLPFHQNDDTHLWINPGVIGMPPNDGTPKVWCALLEEQMDSLHFKYIHFDYDFKTAQQLMKKETLLPQQYAHTLATGIWDNMEILPIMERSQQGKKIIL